MALPKSRAAPHPFGRSKTMASFEGVPRTRAMSESDAGSSFTLPTSLASFEAAPRSRLPSDNSDTGSKPKIDVLAVQRVAGDVAFLVRLSEDWGTRVTYHVKRMIDFVNLDESLRNERKAGNSSLEGLPELPKAGSRFGFRRRLSDIGIGSFSDKQLEGLQAFCAAISSQISDVSEEAPIQAFFAQDPQAAAKDILVRVRLMNDAFSSPTLRSLKGYWNDEGCIWALQEDGRVLRNGAPLGDECTLRESGQGIDRRIERDDGWVVDIAKSTEDRLFWSLPGQDQVEDSVWIRRGEREAKVILQRNSRNSVVHSQHEGRGATLLEGARVVDEKDAAAACAAAAIRSALVV